ncbi:hypothetical protein GCM10022403_099090 [Streptomyces coacervatus]|uniref:Uncharacterized protein n=1 Tax=Streptomyces coacervatus TaxID=647381 RepID=A0ABP7JS43_9ACTN
MLPEELPALENPVEHELLLLIMAPGWGALGQCRMVITWTEREASCPEADCGCELTVTKAAPLTYTGRRSPTSGCGKVMVMTSE